MGSPPRARNVLIFALKRVCLNPKALFPLGASERPLPAASSELRRFGVDFGPLGVGRAGDGGLAVGGERVREWGVANGMQQSTPLSIFRAAGAREVCSGSPVVVLPSRVVGRKVLQLASKMAGVGQILLCFPRRRVGSPLLGVGCPWIVAAASGRG